MTKVLIIEDETSAQMHLEKLLGQVRKEYAIMGRMRTVVDTVNWLKNNNSPDLIFMDIHLSDGISFDILEEVEVNCPIIFITAYDQYAIQAFKTTGIDYILKPISKEDLSDSLDKYSKLTKVHADDFLPKAIDAMGQQGTNEKQSFKERFLLKSGNHMTPVKTDEIAYFYRAEFVFAKTFRDVSYVMDNSLNQLQKVLNHDQFIRLNRQLLVNVNAINKLTPMKPGQLQIEVVPSYHEEIHLSQERSAKLRQRLEGY